MPIHEFKDRIRSAGLKATPARLKLLTFLAKSRIPLSTKDIIKGLGVARSQSRFDTVTFYRNLAAFERTGLISPIQLKDGSRAFELANGHNRSHHHHFVCESCHLIEHLDLCGLDSPTLKLKRRGYQNVHHRLEFFGVCPSCVKKLRLKTASQVSD